MTDTLKKLLQTGAKFQQLGQFELASQIYTSILKAQPQNSDANYNLGLLAVGADKLEEALPFLETALENDADNVLHWVSYIDALLEVGRIEDAQAVFAQAKLNGAKGEGFDKLERKLNGAKGTLLTANSTNLGTKYQLPNILDNISLHQAIKLAKSKVQESNPEEARLIYQDILYKFPKNKRAHDGIKNLTSGLVKKSSKAQELPQDQQQSLIDLYNRGQFQHALKQAETLIQKFPLSAGLFNIQGAILRSLGRLDLSLLAFKKAINIKPDYAEPYKIIGVILKEQGKLDEAIEAYRKAISIKPDYVEVFGNMGNALRKQGKLEEAVETYKKALAIRPNYAEAYYNMGNTLADQGKSEEAIKAYIKALSIKPNYVEAYHNMGVTLKDQGKLEEAIEACKKALLLKPDYAEAYNNLGVTLASQGKLEEATKAYKKSLTFKPDYAEAYNNMAIALRDQGKLEEAIEAYDNALKIKPNYETAKTAKLHQQAHICDWDSIEKDTAVIPKLGTCEKYVSPFDLLPLEDSPKRHQTRSKIYAKAKYPQNPLPPPVKQSKKTNRIRIGYFSTDFKEHPVAYLIAKVLEKHNRDQFEVFGYSLHGSKQSKMRQRLIKSFDCFVNVQGVSDKNVALQARQDGIDIAIDLTGYTQNTRAGIFAYRAAPVQINYLGYPGTLSADFMDYIVTDKCLVPREKQKYYNEKKIYLPNTYMPTDDSREFSTRSLTRRDMGLPENAFVFCCFNNNYKITRLEFSIWMRLLNKVENSVLWLRQSNQQSHLNLKNEAQKQNVEPSRIVFADRVPMDEHLARHRLADLFVDTFNFNAHTTATEALWAGLPVVTKMGQGFAARVAGSLLNAVGLPELITQTNQDYEALILELATNPKMLTKIKQKLATNRQTHPLFDTDQYTKHLEDAYQQAYQNYFDGNPPQTITVQK